MACPTRVHENWRLPGWRLDAFPPPEEYLKIREVMPAYPSRSRLDSSSKSIAFVRNIAAAISASSSSRAMSTMISVTSQTS